MGNRARGADIGERQARASDDARSNGHGHVAHVALQSIRMMVDGDGQEVTAGLAVTAEIKMGRRSVISYLLSPLRWYAHEGVRDR